MRNYNELKILRTIQPSLDCIQIPYSTRNKLSAVQSVNRYPFKTETDEKSYSNNIQPTFTTNLKVQQKYNCVHDQVAKGILKQKKMNNAYNQTLTQIRQDREKLNMKLSLKRIIANQYLCKTPKNKLNTDDNYGIYNKNQKMNKTVRHDGQFKTEYNRGTEKYLTKLNYDEQQGIQQLKKESIVSNKIQLQGIHFRMDQIARKTSKISFKSKFEAVNSIKSNSSMLKGERILKCSSKSNKKHQTNADMSIKKYHDKVTTQISNKNENKINIIDSQQEQIKVLKQLLHEKNQFIVELQCKILKLTENGNCEKENQSILSPKGRKKRKNSKHNFEFSNKSLKNTTIEQYQQTQEQQTKSNLKTMVQHYKMQTNIQIESIQTQTLEDSPQENREIQNDKIQKNNSEKHQQTQKQQVKQNSKIMVEHFKMQTNIEMDNIQTQTILIKTEQKSVSQKYIWPQLSLNSTVQQQVQNFPSNKSNNFNQRIPLQKNTMIEKDCQTSQNFYDFIEDSYLDWFYEEEYKRLKNK